MSSILKALEKVEEAKNPRRTSGAGGLGRGRERRPAWVIPAWALGGAAVAALGTFFLMGGFSKSPTPRQAEVPATIVVPPLNVVPESPRPVPAVAKPAPASPALQAKGKKAPRPAAAAASSGPAAKAKAIQASAAKKAPAAAAKPAQKRAAKAESTPDRPRVAAKPTPVRPAVKQAASAVSTPVPAAVAQAAPEKAHPAVRVTGIAWQKDSESSVAMVNGRPVRQGALVDGYKVEQIYENSVRFSGSGGNLTVPLGAGED